MLSCSSIPTSTYQAYNTVNILVITAIPILTFLIIVLYRAFYRNHEYGDLFYYSIETLFHIKAKEDKEKRGKNLTQTDQLSYQKPLEFFSYTIKSNRRRTVMLLFITVFTISSCLAVFFEGIFLTNQFIKPNANCPYQYDTLDCFGYQSRFDLSPYCYFQCTPGAQAPNGSSFFGEALCFRWVLYDTTTFDVFVQIGICTGILAAFGLFFQGFLALCIYVYKPATDIGRRGCDCRCWSFRQRSCMICGTFGPFQRPWLAYGFLVLYILIFPMGVTAIFIILSVYKQGVTTFTYVVAVTLFILSLPAVMFASMDIVPSVDTTASSDNNTTDADAKTEIKVGRNAVSPISPNTFSPAPTSARRTFVRSEPRTFSNLPLKTTYNE